MKPLTTPRGRSFVVVGNATVVTIDRLAVIGDRFDSDPRIASVSVVSHLNPGQEFLRAVAPAGCAVAVATDLGALIGPLADEVDSLTEKSQHQTSESISEVNCDNWIL